MVIVEVLHIYGQFSFVIFDTDITGFCVFDIFILIIIQDWCCTLQIIIFNSRKLRAEKYSNVAVWSGVSCLWRKINCSTCADLLELCQESVRPRPLWPRMRFENTSIHQFLLLFCSDRTNTHLMWIYFIISFCDRLVVLLNLEWMLAECEVCLPPGEQDRARGPQMS